MTDLGEANVAAKGRRRWCQFSLASLLLVTTVLAVCLGIWVDGARRQQRVIQLIEERGGSFGYSYEMKSGAGKPALPGPAWLRDRLGIDYFDHVQGVWLEGESVTDADLAALADDLPRLTRLDIEHAANVTDAGLAHLAALHDLDGLTLDCPQITDAGLAHLEGLHRLDNVFLRSDHITDAGLVHLRPLKNLRVLRLECSITDAGMEDLTALTKLTKLRCRGAPSDTQRRTIVQALYEPTAIQCTDLPLCDVCDYFADYHGIKLRIDEEALAAVQADRLTPITANSTPNNLATVLDSILGPLDLGWYVGEGELVISTADIVAEKHAGINKLRAVLPNLKVVEFGW